LKNHSRRQSRQSESLVAAAPQDLDKLVRIGKMMRATTEMHAETHIKSIIDRSIKLHHRSQDSDNP
jgi:hypothetical protein